MARPKNAQHWTDEDWRSWRRQNRQKIGEHLWSDRDRADERHDRAQELQQQKATNALVADLDRQGTPKPVQPDHMLPSGFGGLHTKPPRTSGRRADHVDEILKQHGIQERRRR